MNQTKTILSILILIVSLTCHGQTSTTSQNEIAVIEVVGSAEKEIVPDEIYIAITIRERESGKDKVSIDKQEAALKDALQKLGISLENLFLSDANANYIPVKWSKKDVITKTEYLLKVGDALMVGKVFEKLDEIKITDARISRVSHSKLEDYKKEVRIMAITAAKDKADYLLTAIGQERGKAIKVNEQALSDRIEDSNLNVTGTRNEAIYYNMNEWQKSSINSDQIIQFQKIKLQSAIYVKFEIK